MPFLAQWPDHWPKGRIYEKPVISLDLLPTAAAAAGVKLSDAPGLDGVDLGRFLRVGGESGNPHDQLFWRSGSNTAVRSRQWKLWQAGETVSLLYDLSRDIGEKENLSQERPKVLEGLLAELGSWTEKLMKPRWPTPKTIPVDIDGIEIELSH